MPYQLKPLLAEDALDVIRPHGGTVSNFVITGLSLESARRIEAFLGPEHCGTPCQAGGTWTLRVMGLR